MKILIYGLHFKPDLIGIGKYTGEMADWLHDRGHEIRIITAPHFYPEWKKVKPTLFYEKEHNPFLTWRCPIYVPRKPKGLTRLLHSLSFMISSIPLLIRNIFWKPNFIISIEPPFLTAPFASLSAKLIGAKSILHIQDLEIDAAYSLKLLKSGILYKIIKRFEKFILNSFDIVSTISPMMKIQILNSGINEERIYILPNWADTELINPNINNDYLKKRFDIKQNQKVILYSGNIGEKQNLPMVINIAKAMQSKKDYLFLFIGDGAAKNKLVEMVKTENLQNVLFYPLLPLEDLGSLLTLADIHLVTQDKNISDFVLPSKLTNILSAGGVSIISSNPDTQLAQLVKEFNLGYLIEPNNEEALSGAINHLFSNEQKHLNISKNARQYAETNLSKNLILENFERNVLI